MKRGCVDKWTLVLGYRYIGNAAVFDLGKYSFMGGLAAMYAWRSVYWSEQVSSRTRALLMMDWIIRWVVLLSIRAVTL